MASFTNIAVELQLLIIEHLVPEHPSRLVADLYGKNVFTYASPLTDLLNLSQVNRHFRTIVVPYLFKNIAFHNSAKSGASVQCIAESTMASHVQTLHYQPDITKMLPYDDPVGQDTYGEERRLTAVAKPDQLPHVVVDVLKNLATFKNLERLTVVFFIEYWLFRNLLDCKVFGQPLHVENHEDDDNEDAHGASAEKLEAWRVLMNRSYIAIAQNAAGAVKHLELQNVVPKRVSAWLDPTWHAFLGSLETFTISLCQGADSGEYHISTYEAHPRFARNLANYFFEHLQNVTRFEFKTNFGSALGCGGQFPHAQFPLHRQHMPRLKHIELHYIFVSEQLHNALCTRNTLETVHLVDCLALGTVLEDPEDEETVGGITWADFLDSVRKSGMSNLRELIVKADDIFSALYDSWDPPSMSFEELGRYAFLYGVLWSRFGFIDLDEEAIQRRFEEGEDQTAWDELQKVVGDNARTAEKTQSPRPRQLHLK